MENNSKVYKFDAYIKLTETGNLHFGFAPPGNKISKRTIKQWTTKASLFYSDKFNEVRIYNQMPAENCGIEFWRKYFGKDKFHKFIKFCNYIKHKIETNILTVKTIFKIDEDEMKTMAFEMFHINSPIKYDIVRTDVAVCELPEEIITQVTINNNKSLHVTEIDKDTSKKINTDFAELYPVKIEYNVNTNKKLLLL